MDFDIHPFVGPKILASICSEEARFSWSSKINEYIVYSEKFPHPDFINTNFLLNNENHQLTILEALTLAGNLYMEENRYLFPKSSKNDH